MGVAPGLSAPAISRNAEWISWLQEEASAARAGPIVAVASAPAAAAVSNVLRTFSMGSDLNGKSVPRH